MEGGVLLNGSWILDIHIIHVFVRICFIHMMLLILVLSIWAMMPYVRLLESVLLKTHDGAIRTLTKVWHVPDLNPNLVSLGAFEAKGFGYLLFS